MSGIAEFSETEVEHGSRPRPRPCRDGIVMSRSRSPSLTLDPCCDTLLTRWLGHIIHQRWDTYIFDCFWKYGKKTLCQCSGLMGCTTVGTKILCRGCPQNCILECLLECVLECLIYCFLDFLLDCLLGFLLDCLLKYFLDILIYFLLDCQLGCLLDCLLNRDVLTWGENWLHSWDLGLFLIETLDQFPDLYRLWFSPAVQFLSYNWE